MIGQVLAHMIRVEQCFPEKGGDMNVVYRIEDLIAVAPGADESDSAQFGEMMRNGRCRYRHLLAQLIDAVLIICQQKNDLGSRRIAQGFEYFDDIR